ncbi:MAG: RNA methyltransferase [Rubricoccaceae bacterium]|nr:RNA methyltransferase [Rubricoccaceae bacterium]
MPTLSPRFPHSAALHVGGRAYPAGTVWDVLSPFLTERRRTRIAAVAAGRTYSVLPVFERMADAGNLHAALRSAEGLGYGAAALVAPEHEAGPLAERYAAEGDADAAALGKRGSARAAQGAHKWLALTLYADADAFVDAAHARGYAVAVTHLAADAVPIAAWDFTRPTALVFGNEAEGVSDELLARADANVVLPIDGFVQSYNVSVAAALALYHARQDRLARQGRHGDLTEDEQAVLAAHYALRSVAAAAQILARDAGERDA